MVHNYIGDFVNNCVDFDGFMLLIQRDFDKFESWQKDSKKQSLEELRKNYNYWRAHFKETLEKYGDWEQDEKDKDISTFMGKITYFYYLSRIAWKVLSVYTEKIQKENKTLKKSQKAKKKPKTRKRKV